MWPLWWVNAMLTMSQLETILHFLVATVPCRLWKLSFSFLYIALPFWSWWMKLCMCTYKKITETSETVASMKNRNNAKTAANYHSAQTSRIHRLYLTFDIMSVIRDWKMRITPWCEAKVRPLKARLQQFNGCRRYSAASSTVTLLFLEGPTQRHFNAYVKLMPTYARSSYSLQADLTSHFVKWLLGTLVSIAALEQQLLALLIHFINPSLTVPRRNFMRRKILEWQVHLQCYLRSYVSKAVNLVIWRMIWDLSSLKVVIWLSLWIALTTVEWCKVAYWISNCLKFLILVRLRVMRCWI